MSDIAPEAASMWYNRAASSLPELEEDFRGGLGVALIEGRVGDSQSLHVDEIVGGMESPIWRDRLIVADAQWQLRSGVPLEGVLERLGQCQTEVWSFAGFLGCITAVPADKSEVRDSMLDVAEGLLPAFPEGFDLAELLISFSKSSTGNRSREAIGRAIGICSVRAENLFGTRSRLLASAAEVLAQFDSDHALDIAYSVFEKEEMRVLSHILNVAIGDRAEVDALLGEQLMRLQSSSLGSQFVLVGSAVPILERTYGPGYVASALDLVLDARRL
jgi:hypothetical protein